VRGSDERPSGIRRAKRSPDDEVQIGAAYLASMARLLVAIDGDLAGFGRHAYEWVSTNTTLSTLAQLDSLLRPLERLAFDLRMKRREYLEKQLRAIQINENTFLKLHIGSGEYSLDSWINIDAYPAQLAMDVRWGLPFPDNSVAFVFLSHTLEHLFYPREALQLAKDIKRVLRPGGVLRVIVPDVEKCLRAYVEDDKEFFASRRKTWTWWPKDVTRLQEVLCYAGAGSWFGLASHKFGYDYETLCHLFAMAGFRNVKRSEYMQSEYAELRIDKASKVAGAMYGNRYYSLFAEATA